MTQSHLIKVARQEIEVWDHSKTMPRGLPMAILFAFVHRVITGNTVEESFFKSNATHIPDYEI